MSASRQRAIAAARAAHEKLASDIVVLEVGSVLGITEYFVIAGARNTRLSKAVATEVEIGISRFDGGQPLRVEGMDDKQWILLDYGDIVVHIFVEETRAYYELERLWRDVESVDWREDSLAAEG